jgi:Tfp pilus assembly protein PilE
VKLLAKNQKGMSIKELIIVILIMVTLFLLSVPLFYNLREKARSQEQKKMLLEIPPAEPIQLH